MLIKKVLVFAFAIVLLAAGCGGDRSTEITNTGSRARRTFIMIHFEAGHRACKENDLPPGLNLPEEFRLKELGWQEYFWPTAVALVEKADEYGFTLTLAFTPQWGRFIANDAARLNVVRQWKAQGHEIGFHHHPFHPITHPDWDGYSGMAEAAYDPLYVGPVNTGYLELSALASPGEIVSSTMGGLPEDFPPPMTSPVLVNGEGNAADSYPQLGPVRSLKPVKSHPLINHIERDLLQLAIRSFTTVMDISLEDALPVLQEQYMNMADDEVFGIVWHEFDYLQAEDSYIQWFDFIKENGNRVKTMKEISLEYVD